MAKIRIAQKDTYEAHMLWPPSPVVWVSSLSKDGVADLAPFSLNQFYSYLANWPQVIVIGIGGHTGPIVRGKGTKKTYQNITATKDFVVNIPSEEHIEKINLTALEKPPGFDKFKAYDLTPTPSQVVRSPSVGECKVHYECKLMKIDDYGGHSEAVYGNVLAVVAEESVLSKKADEKVAAINPIYYYGVGAGKGLYFSAGRIIGERDDSKYT
ncbi:MAG: flavin reductase family protein [Deltaproteobacteria bacterium]|nr:flavin reductase family protein [Deltaproteobacteria bacterium]